MAASTEAQFIPWYWDRIDLFAGVDPRARGDFLALAEGLQFKKGRHIFRAQDKATHAYFLQSGAVKVYDLNPNGLVTLFWFCLPGDLLGPGAITGTQFQGVNAQVVADATVLAIRRTDLEEVLCANPRLALNLIRVVGSRLRLVSEMMIDAQAFRAEQRLARLLLRLARNWGLLSQSGIELPLKLPHHELANMVGSCRQTVNTLLRQFQVDGLIAVDKRTITLANIPALQALASVDNSQTPGLPAKARHVSDRA